MELEKFAANAFEEALTSEKRAAEYRVLNDKSREAAAMVVAVVGSDMSRLATALAADLAALRQELIGRVTK